MKKYLIMFIVATMLLTGCAKENIAPTPTATETQEVIENITPTPTATQEVVENNTEEPTPKKQVVTKQVELQEYLSLKIGNGNGEVGYIEAGDGDMGQCPKSFALDENGKIYILDTVNDRVLVFNGETLENTVDYFNIINITDKMDVDVEKFGLYHDEIIVLNETTGKVHELKANGELISVIDLPEGMEPVDVYDFAIVDDELVMIDLDFVNHRYVKQQNKFQLGGKRLNISQNPTEYSIELDGNKIKLPKKENEGLAYIGSNKDMICFSVYAENVYDRYILAYDYDGNILYKVQTSMENAEHSPLIDIRFDGDKSVYFMSCELDAVKIYKAVLDD